MAAHVSNLLQDLNDSRDAKSALLELSKIRSSLGYISVAQADHILELLLPHSNQEGEAESLEHIFLLLAEYLKTPEGKSPERLKRAIKAAVDVLSRGHLVRQPDLACAACIFLTKAGMSAANVDFDPVCEEEPVMSFLVNHRETLRASTHVPDLIHSLGLEASQSQDWQRSLWTLCAVLRLWSSLEEEQGGRNNGATVDSVMLQLFSVKAAVQSIATSRAGYRVGASGIEDLKQLAILLSSCILSSDKCLKGGGLMASTGFLSALSHSSTKHAPLLDEFKELRRNLLAACLSYQSPESERSLPDKLLLFCTAETILSTQAAELNPDSMLDRCILPAFVEEVYNLEELMYPILRQGNTTDSSLRLSPQMKRFCNNLLLYIVKSTAPGHQQRLTMTLAWISKGSRQLSSEYAFALLSSKSPRQGDESLFQVLVRAFVFTIKVLSAIWAASDANQRPQIGAEILNICAKLQCCRVQLPEYTTLLKDVFSQVAQSNQAADIFLEQTICYDRLIQPLESLAAPGTSHRPQVSPQRENDQSAGSSHQVDAQSTAESWENDTAFMNDNNAKKSTFRWQADKVLAAEMQFRFTLLAPCIQRLPQDKVIRILLPTVLLYLGHPEKSLVSSAHSLFCSIIQVCDQAEQLAPYYTARALAFYPQTTPIDSLTVGLDALSRQIPSGDPSSAFIVQKVSERLSQLAASHAEPSHLLELSQLLGYLLLIVDFQVLDVCLEIAESCFLGLDGKIAASLVDGMGKTLTNSSDYARKVRLVRWFHDLRSQC